MLVNYMEVIIDEQLPGILKDYASSICTCDRCIEDIKALALNNLKPMYAASDKGIVYSKINELTTQFIVDITTELIQAIETVSKNPRHEINEQ